MKFFLIFLLFLLFPLYLGGIWSSVCFILPFFFLFFFFRLEGWKPLGIIVLTFYSNSILISSPLSFDSLLGKEVKKSIINSEMTSGGAVYSQAFCFFKFRRFTYFTDSNFVGSLFVFLNCYSLVIAICLFY
jgi:hypothetical protein